MSQTSRSNVRPVKGVWNSPSAPERASMLRLTLRAQSRSETGPDRFKNSRLDISITQKMTNGNQDVTWTECVAVGSEGFVRSIESRFKVANKWRSWLMAIDGSCAKPEPITTLVADPPKAERDGSHRARKRTRKTAVTRFCIDSEMRKAFRRNTLLRSDPD